MAAWRAFPHDASGFAYEGSALAAHWDRLHRGDREPRPASEALADAWRAYHRGAFEEAVERGLALGVEGYYVANKAAGIYATHLEDDEDRRLAIYREVADRAEEAQVALPDHANAFYFHAYALGRFSQGISITKALAQGIGGKVRQSLERALELEPNHADAHIAMGLYHAEIIDKVGKMVGRLTYGASPDAALRHFEQALEHFPESPVARMEFANGLLLLKGGKAQDEATTLYVEASEATPADAMERLDVELARSELE